MAGEGAIRARWNAALTQEIAASCYSRVLGIAAASMGPGRGYDALWPSGKMVTGWSLQPMTHVLASSGVDHVGYMLHASP